MPSYDFRQLAPPDFEELARDLLQAEWKCVLESFARGRDGGIDFRLVRNGHTTIIQVKHFVGSGLPKLVSTLKEENEKVSKLKADRYVLVTSVPITPANKDKIIEVMPDAPLVPEDIIGPADLNAALERHSAVHREHFKLWLSSTEILDRILHSGVYNRTAAEMSTIRRMLPKFVLNDSVPSARKMLEEGGALIIAGDPGVGKSTLARILLWQHAEQEWEIFVVDDIAEAIRHAQTPGKRIIFFDDFLGQIRLTEDYARRVDARLPTILNTVFFNKNIRFVLTTRDYILSQARIMSARINKTTKSIREYVLDVGTYTRGVKARILYNHIFFSNLDPDHKLGMLEGDFYLSIIDHKNFNPRLIEAVTDRDFLARRNGPVKDVIKAVLENPEELWEEPYRQHISADARILLIAMALNGRLAPRGVLKESFGRVSRSMNAPVHATDIEQRFRQAFREMDGTAIGLVNDFVQFVNPGIRDFLVSVIIVDKLLPALVQNIATYPELYEALAIQETSRKRGLGGRVAAAEWVAAFQRLMDEGNYQHSYFMLAIGLYEVTGAEEFLVSIAQYLDNFEAAGWAESDAIDAIELLEKSALNGLPTSSAERVSEVATTTAAKLLSQQAKWLDLDDVRSLIDALQSYGSDRPTADSAIQTALESIDFNIRDQLGSISSIQSLEDFEDAILPLMRANKYPTKNVTHEISLKRDNLLMYGDEQSDSDTTTTSATPVTPTITTDAIKSLFRGLRSEVAVAHVDPLAMTPPPGSVDETEI